MRIIAGESKGRRIKSPKRDSVIKPILSRARQSFFDTIRPRVKECNFLDLFAGSGVVGLEALSRGARRVVFVDSGKEAFKLISANIEALGYSQKAQVVRADVLGGGPAAAAFKLPQGELFDIVFVAPPYLGEDRRGAILVMSVPTLASLVASSVMAPRSWVIVQHHKKEPWDGLPPEFKIWRQVKFGESMLTYLEYEPK
ncbi:MAG: 16S rRNA (guanine(966)-N(2))-methyltransferase RsmD [Elusimicrobiota bacterium]